MSCEIVGLDQSVDCIASDGGIYESYCIPAEFVTAISFSAVDDGVAAFTLVGGVWTKFIYDDDDSAFYNQEGERTNNKVSITQVAFLKFAGINTAKVEAVNKVIGCCNLIWIHRFNSGLGLVQGIDRDMSLDSTDATYTSSKKKAKVTPNVMTDTGDNEDRVEYNIDSTGRHYSVPLTLAFDYATGLPLV